MQLEDYFDFLAPDDIRMQGTALVSSRCSMNTSIVRNRLRKFSSVFPL